MKKILIDLETSGLDETQHVVFSIGAAIVDGDAYHEFFVDILPTAEEFAAAAPEALKVNGFTFAMLQATGICRDDAVIRFAQWLKLHDVCTETTQYVGQNPDFDLRFLNALMGSWLSFLDFPMKNPVDTRALAREYASKTGTKFASFSGANIAKTIGVEPEPALHTALGGVAALHRNYTKLTELLGQL